MGSIEYVRVCRYHAFPVLVLCWLVFSTGGEMILARHAISPERNPTFMRRGFGDAATEAAQVTQMGGTLASATIGTLSATGTVALPALTIPLIGAGVAAVTVAIALIKNSGCGDTCIIASNDANKIEPLLQQNAAAYLAGPRTVSSQQQALANFDQIWAALVQACSNPALGNAGKRCISDRQASSCKWQGADGSCWNWFIGYRDPIANDLNVVPDPSPVAAAASSLPSVFVSGDGSINWGTLFIPVALLVALWVVS